MITRQSGAGRNPIARHSGMGRNLFARQSGAGRNPDRRSIKWWFGFLLPACLIGMAGCGYQMIGGGNLPGGVQTIGVALLENRTTESGLDVMVTDALITELNRRHKGGSSDPQNADAVLRGTIKTLGSDTIAHRGTHTALASKVYIVVSLELSQKDGRELWKDDKVRAEQPYAVVGNDATATDANRLEAVSLLVNRLAEAVIRRLTDEF